MITLSGVIMRCNICAPVLWTLNTIVVEHTLQSVHTALVGPMSSVERHTSQPAHLPLISFPGMTVVAYVVADMGSRTTSSSEYISFTFATSVELPLTTVLATTGSIVHMVMTDCVVIHLRMGRNFLVSPSTRLS